MVGRLELLIGHAGRSLPITGIRDALCFLFFIMKNYFYFLQVIYERREAVISELLIVHYYTSNVCIHKRGADQFNQFYLARSQVFHKILNLLKKFFLLLYKYITYLVRLLTRHSNALCQNVGCFSFNFFFLFQTQVLIFIPYKQNIQKIQ